MINENLLPAVIVDLVKKFKETKDINEQVILHARLRDINDFVNLALTTQTTRNLKK